ncbi:septal ring lytic transglycosylase RlpA family protein [Stenotrophomonas chelatiphaga]|uniref:septal ring lytic transglycosylase RlpA family protein n=1 Tax=Stenotrophomonas chelatiphaga TaxID=517011 RepID=UPI0028A19CA6|nr:septal ring lytic transglycosylase RlpA family protein [Stenotrophomonas chelatiphaga]
MNIRWWVPGALILALAACSSAPKKPGGTASTGGKPATTVVQQGKGGSRPAHCPEGSPYAAASEDLATRGNYTAGGLYKPGVKDTTPTYVPNVACIPEPEVQDLARSAIGNKTPYEVLGKQYKVMDSTRGYAEQGTASYYGAKFHGRLTSNREVYDMYQFTAAHKTLPLPSFARVTNLDNGESVIVRVNDRGPFHDGRVIDLSYAAAVRLGITQRGTGNVEVRALQPGEGNLLADAKPTRAERRATTMVAATAAAPSAIDALVNRLPAQAPAAATPAPAPAAAPRTVAAAARTPTGAEAYRYRVADSAKPGSADNFDRWMRDNNVRVATGKPATPVVTAAGRQSDKPSATARPTAIAATAAPLAAPASATLSQQVLGNVLLQVASFASRDNATRAQGQLTAAGIVGATISDIAAGGRTLWRLRVPANDHANATELAGRIAGLGFGSPQIVKE